MAKGVSKPRRREEQSIRKDWNDMTGESVRGMKAKVKFLTTKGVNARELASVRAQERMVLREEKAKIRNKADGNNDLINRRKQENL